MLLISTGQTKDATLLRRLAHEAGMRVVTDTNARVVELARTLRPTAVVLDVMQRGGEGLELLAALRLGAQTRSVPVFAIAQTEDEFIQSVSMELGALACVSAPLDSTFMTLVVQTTRAEPTLNRVGTESSVG